MKLKLTLQSSGLSSVGAGSRDLVATIDSSATIGDLAAYLVRADPQRGDVRGEVRGDGDLTLTVVDQHDQLDRAVDPRSTIPESGLRSGVTVAVTSCGASFIDSGPTVAVVAVVAGPDSGKEFRLRRGTAYIGRGHGCEVQVSDSSVSRRHAKVLVADG
ncbi:MAG: FHA domain-containing protein, partial [Phycicoccus sp.]|nr:FHA domain-containing protein [Phycicoccus sp.]